MKNLLLVILGAMAASLVWVCFTSSAVANVMVGFEQILVTSWGVATVMDLYFGFFMIALIATITEENKLMKFLWFPLTFFLGNFAAAIFLFRVLMKHSSWTEALTLGRKS